MIGLDTHKKKCFIFNTLGDTKTLKIIKCFAKVEPFGCAVSLTLLKIEHFFAIDSKSKNDRGYRIPMINLGKSKEVTAVFKL